MRLLLVNCSKIATKNFPRLCIGVFKADKISLKDGQLSTYFLCNLQESYIITGLVPPGFRCLRKLETSIKGSLNCFKLQIIFKSQNNLCNNFRFKDPIPQIYKPGIFYKF